MRGNLGNYKYCFEYSYYYTQEVGEDYGISDLEIINSANSKIVYETSSYEDFVIYSTYKKEYVLSEYDNLALEVLNRMGDYENIIYFALPISSILVLVMVVYLIIAIGHTKGKEGIDTNDLDKIPFEILFAIMIFILVIGGLVLATFSINTMKEYYKLMISGMITAYFVVYTAIAIVITTFIKRIKSKTLMKTTIIGMIIKWFNKVFKNINKGVITFVNSKRITTRLILLVIAYILVIIVIPSVCDSLGITIGLGILIDIGITIWAFYQIIRRINCFEKIESQLKDIYEGNNNNKLMIEDFTPEFTNIVEYINDISNGFENAVQEGIKSEKMKTELITNVSHDIKTPLTSIINYVDLLKQENIDNEKVNEYIEILEAKSHRLKRLTEDLVEASKASSGNLKLNLEKINISELINQTTGEFEDRFKENGLEIFTKLPPDKVFIEADSRYMFRVIENLFSNIAKYAAKNTRVYIDIMTYGDKVNISIKNISAEKLNISTEELMQRFVRGDKSRTTEGSGLGLSISKDLTELQKGKFEIQIDGDLFKVELEFERI